jgi:eukaryotic-like serine/threonine-protein kinase
MRYSSGRMSLAPGTRIASYEIVAAIGAGGMGQVYRARDTKLGRDVAVKILPPHLATDPEARARFEREARAVAALSHPNILAIHDFGVQNGIAYAVLELLVGETLRQRMSGAAMPSRKALEIATQIAHGLSAAHEHDIAHRDLKPENIFVCTDGRVKILDFGLAKAVGPQAPGATDGSSDTELRHTDPGTVLGTVGYMSPEQVRGRPADKRSDIFSFGCVLFEMLTGHRAFHGETAAETMTAILRQEPPEIATAPLPASLEPIVRHCLEKRPEDRFQSARDLGFVLQAQTGGSASGASRPATIPAPVPHRSFGPLVWIGGAAAVAALAFFAGRQFAAAPAAESIQAMAFRQVTDQPGVETSPSLSPDGKTVVYSCDASGNTDLYLMRIGSRAPVPLTADSPLADYQPAWSPEGERIAFRSDRDGGGIFLMTSTGESVRRLTDYGYSPSWSPEGTEIVVSAGAFYSPTDRGATVRGLWAVDVKSGKRRDLATAYEGLQPSWSPHGYRIAVWGLRGNSGQRDIWTFAADGSDATHEGVTVTDDAALDWSPAWAPDGTHLYFSSNRGGTMNLWRIAIDERTGRVSGEPQPITTPSIWSGNFSLSRDGTTMAYASLDWRSTLLRVELDANREALVGAPVPILKSTRPIRDHEMSPDGQWIAFMESGTQEDLLVARTDGTHYRRLTDDSFRDRAPAWSPDGKQLVFYSDRSGSYELWRIRPDASGLEKMTAFGGGANFSVWSPDGTRLAFSGVNAKGWYLIPSDAKELPPTTPEPALAAGVDFWPFSWSPDNTRIAGAVRRTDGSLQGLAIYTLATKRYEPIKNLNVEDSFWAIPKWLADSRRLIVRDSHGLSLVDPAGSVKRLLSVRGYAVGRSMGVSKDNRWITYTETGTEGDVWIATLREPVSSR